MLFVGYFEGIESERGLEWRCADSLSLRAFIGISQAARVPDHSSLSRMRDRLDTSVCGAVFELVLGLVKSNGLLRGKVAGVDSTYLRADASMKGIVRKDTGDDYATYLKTITETADSATPTAEDAQRIDRARKGKTTSNKYWKSVSDEDARIVRLKDGRTRLGDKAEHVVDLETGAVLAATIYHANESDVATLALSRPATRPQHPPSGEQSRSSPTRVITRSNSCSRFAKPNTERISRRRDRAAIATLKTRVACAPARHFTITAKG